MSSNNHSGEVKFFSSKMRLEYGDWHGKEDQHRRDMVVSVLGEINRQKYTLVGDVTFAYRYSQRGDNLTDIPLPADDNITEPDTVEIEISCSCRPLKVRTVRL